MAEYNIYKDIAERTGGDVYLGVVGPVRTGKSTFIKKFMDLFVIPNINDINSKERAQDELPQSAGGRTIMTTEPKFIPNEAVEITFDDNAKMKVRMIDCVGYIVDSALRHIENDVPRMVQTPWSNSPIPFNEAAEIGTKKVICDHSSIGILVTTDGSVTELSREDYVRAEERVAEELKKKNKPYIVILNTSNPVSENSIRLSRELEEKYDAPVMPLDCANLTENNINEIMSRLLYEFPVNEIDIELPKWVEELDREHPLKSNLIKLFREKFSSIKNLRQIKNNLWYALLKFLCFWLYIFGFLKI